MARTSDAAKARRKAKRAPKGGKAGNQGHFHGQRAEVIHDALPEFLTLKGQPRQVHKAFWLCFFAKFWAIFHWTLGPHEDPPPRDPEADATGGSRAPSPEIEDEELLHQKALIIELTQKVRSMRSIRLFDAYTDVVFTADKGALSLSCICSTPQAKPVGTTAEISPERCGTQYSSSQAC